LVEQARRKEEKVLLVVQKKIPRIVFMASNKGVELLEKMQAKLKLVMVMKVAVNEANIIRYGQHQHKDGMVHDI